MSNDTKILPTLNELREKGESDPEASLIFQALGAASACWERMEGTGLFNSDRAKRIGDELLFELRGEQTITTKQAIDHLREALRDEDYRIGWEANIAMAFKDQWATTKQKDGEADPYYIHRIANRAAAAFLDQLIGKDMGDVDGMAAVAKLHQKTRPIQP